MFFPCTDATLEELAVRDPVSVSVLRFTPQVPLRMRVPVQSGEKVAQAEPRMRFLVHTLGFDLVGHGRVECLLCFMAVKFWKALLRSFGLTRCGLSPHVRQSALYRCICHGALSSVVYRGNKRFQPASCSANLNLRSSDQWVGTVTFPYLPETPRGGCSMFSSSGQGGASVTRAERELLVSSLFWAYEAAAPPARG